MKRMIWVAGLLPLTAVAQIICALGPNASAYRPSSDERPSGDAMELANRTNAAAKTVCGTNCPTIVLFRNPTAPNVLLTPDAARAKIVYAPATFTSVYDRYGDPGILALLAHILGHALDDAIGAAWMNKYWSTELRSDAWAGCILARDNFSQSDVKGALAVLAEYPPQSETNWSVRLPAIREGYTHCGGRLPFKQ